MATRFPVVLPVKRHNPVNRRLHLVDIENVIGGAIFSPGEVRIARELIESLVGTVKFEPVIIGVSHMGMFQVHQAWPGARRLVQSGPDGADLKLIDELRHADIAKRVSEVVLVSGDGIFTDSVVQLTARGVKVTIVAPQDGCSRRLRMAAHQTILFTRPEADFKDAA